MDTLAFSDSALAVSSALSSLDRIRGFDGSLVGSYRKLAFLISERFFRRS